MKSWTGMSMRRRWAAILLGALATTAYLVPGVRAEEEYAHRAVYHTQKVEMMEVGDVPGHSVAIVEQPGMVFITKGPFAGETGTRKGITLTDSVKGKGTSISYLTYTFPDGSTQSFKATGTFTAVEGGKRSLAEGTWEFLGGTGRFEGFQGKGTYKAERVGPPQAGSSSYVDVTGTLRK